MDYGVAEEVAPGIRRIVANNPGPYTFLGTNTYLVGSGDVAVIDPGPADERHLKAIAEATKGSGSAHILVTHSHRDHCDGARAFRNARRRDLELRSDRHRAAQARRVSAKRSSTRPSCPTAD